jgi:hypothetical protein
MKRRLLPQPSPRDASSFWSTGEGNGSSKRNDCRKGTLQLRGRKTSNWSNILDFKTLTSLSVRLAESVSIPPLPQHLITTLSYFDTAKFPPLSDSPWTSK